MRPSISIVCLGIFLTLASGCKLPNLGGPAKMRADGIGTSTNSSLHGSNAILDPNADLLAAQYQVNVYTGARICTGQVVVKIKANFATDGQLLQIPQGKVSCLAGLLGEFDLAQTFAALGTAKGNANNTAVVVTNNVIRLKGWETQVYASPYRPFLPSFLAAPRDQLKVLMLEDKVTVTDAATNATATGVVGMRTISMDEPYKADLMGRNFDKNVHFEVINKGFEGIEKVENILFDRLEMIVSLDPFAIPYLVLETRVKDLESVAPGATGGILGGAPTTDLLSSTLDGLIKLTTVRIELKLQAMKGLAP